MEVMMKRFWAAVIDVVICYMLSSILFGCVWGIFKGLHGSDLHTISRMTVRGIKFVISFLAYFSYSVLFDSLSQGNTLGRDMTGYRFAPVEEELEDAWIIKHSFFKAIAAKLWFITVIYYFITSKMPYDGILGIGGENDYIHFEEGIKRKEQYAGKRIVAVMIDVGIMMLVLTIITFIVFCYTLIVTHGEKTNVYVSFTNIYAVLYFFLYFFVTQIIFRGSSIGKKIMGIRLAAEGKFDSLMVLKHSLLKTVAFYLWPISLIYCLVTGTMFYDEWLKLEVVA